MSACQAVLLTPSISLRLIQALSCTQIMLETPLIPFYVFNSLRTLLTIQRRMVILRNAVTKDPPALAVHYLPAKPFGLLSYENSRVVLVSLTKFLRPYLNFPGLSLLITPLECTLTRPLLATLISILQALSPFLSSFCALFCTTGTPQLLCIQALPHSFHRNGGVGVPLRLYFVARTFVPCLSTFDF